MIGNLLTDIDTTLAQNDFDSSDPSWHQLYALRKHLDDQQRTLVTLPASAEEESDADFDPLVLTARRMLADSPRAPSVNAIHQVAKVTASVDRFLRYVEPGPKDRLPKR
jgi:hypothetical protein